MLAEVCKKAGIDVPIYVSYYKKKERVYVIDKPILYSEISSNGETKEEISNRLLNRCNELGKMTFDKEFLKKVKKENKKDK